MAERPPSRGVCSKVNRVLGSAGEGRGEGRKEMGLDIKRERPHPVQSMKTVHYTDCWWRGGVSLQAKRAGEHSGWR